MKDMTQISYQEAIQSLREQVKPMMGELSLYEIANRLPEYDRCVVYAICGEIEYEKRGVTLE